MYGALRMRVANPVLSQWTPLSGRRKTPEVRWPHATDLGCLALDVSATDSGLGTCGPAVRLGKLLAGTTDCFEAIDLPAGASLESVASMFRFSASRMHH